MKLLVGLGNPGAEYARHRHNIGFLAVEAIAGCHNFEPWKKKFHGLLAEGVLGGGKCLLLKPQTYMNRSGLSVGEAAMFYKIPPEDILVFHDELDLPFGKVKVKQGGGNAGHNGLKDIDRVMGPDFWRVRLGIGHPGDRERVTGHVLGNFDKSELQPLEEVLDRVSEAAGLFTTEGGKALQHALHVPDEKEAKVKTPEERKTNGS